VLQIKVDSVDSVSSKPSQNIKTLKSQLLYEPRRIPARDITLVFIKMKKDILEAHFQTYLRTKDECSISTRWEKYADLFQEDGFVDHHGFGIFQGRTGIREYITKSIAPFGTMTFPIDWVAFDEATNAVVFQVQNAFPSPPFDKGSAAFQFPNWTRLVFATNGRIVSEETVYNPERDAKRTFKAWSKAGGKFEAKEQLKYKHSVYPTKSKL
jgi:hypothetical protein